VGPNHGIKLTWEERFGALVEYKKKTGNCNVPQRWPDNPRLATWVSTQRQIKNRLTSDQVRRLNELGFAWEPQEAAWEEMFGALVEYKKKTGNCSVPNEWPENPQLGRWVNTQRLTKERLTPDRVKRLNELGFVWEPQEAAWEEKFKALVEYKKKTGNCNVPQGWPDNPKLANWVTNQRQKKDRLTSEQIRRLNDLGFGWGPLKKNWEEMFAALVDYHKKTGNCNVPVNWPENPQLGRWISQQRRSRDRLTPERIKRLNKLGIVWGQKKALWEEMYQALVEYKKKFGDCKVPDDWPENPKLGTWVSNQRTRKEQLTSDRIKKLDGLGFVWDVRDAFWEKMFKELVEYKKKYGDCKVPDDWSENKKLGTWVGKQRQRKNQLTPERIDRLNRIGFVWEAKKIFWEEMFEALVEYKKRTGNCNVPRNWPENKPLANWVHTQRNKKDRLTPDRIQRLDEIGFVWEIRKRK
jgi:hypothetical protein